MLSDADLPFSSDCFDSDLSLDRFSLLDFFSLLLLSFSGLSRSLSLLLPLSDLSLLRLSRSLSLDFSEYLDLDDLDLDLERERLDLDLERLLGERERLRRRGDLFLRSFDLEGDRRDLEKLSINIHNTHAHNKYAYDYFHVRAIAFIKYTSFFTVANFKIFYFSRLRNYH